jgi:hypothetical protein
MSYPILWSPARARQVLTTESRQKARELFLQTHRSFRRIRVDFCKEADVAGEFVEEEQLRAIVQAGRLEADNRLFFVVGEAGSGKSELCQWLEYTVDAERSLAIHIPRSMTSAAHVVALLRKRAGALSLSLRHVPLAAQAEHIALSALVLLYERGGLGSAPIEAWAALLRGAAMRRALVEHLEAAEAGEYGHALLASDAQVGALCAEHRIEVVPASLPSIGAGLQQILARAMEQALCMGDLHTPLRQLSERIVAQGRRPLLLLEDVTTFRFLGDRLLDYLLDLTSGHFDAVIGVTTGFERTQLPGATLAGDLTHIHHRLRARFALTDEQGCAYSLEDDVIEFARAYLRAVKHGAAVSPLQPDVERIFGADLYPFTDTALLRAFGSLQEEGNPRQTPRLFLEYVLGAALQADDLPSAALDRSAYLSRPPALFRSDEVGDERLQSVLRWYGQVGDEAVTLDSRLPALWNIPVPEQLLADGVVRVSRAYILQPPGAGEPGQQWQQELRELQQWLTSGGLYPSREMLKRGIERALLALGDPRSLASRSALSSAQAAVYYARGDERLPIYLGRESGDQPSSEAYVKVQVTGSAEERVILEELVYLALSGAQLSQVCQNVTLTLDWAQRHWDAYHREIDALLSRHLGGISVEHLIWVGWRMACALSGDPWGERPHVRTHDNDAAPYEHISPWSREQSNGCYAAGRELLSWHETLRRLFLGAFTLHDTLLDRERCMDAARQIEDRAVVAKLAHLSLRSFRTLPYKIRPTGQRLLDLLAPLQRYALALIQLDADSALRADLADLERRAAKLAAQEHVDVRALHDQVAALRQRCGEVGVTWREQWDSDTETLLNTMRLGLQPLRDEMQALLSATAQSYTDRACDLWGYQEFRHRLRPIVQHPFWDASATLWAIQSELIQAAQARYRREARSLTGTQSYRALRRTALAIWQELEQ